MANQPNTREHHKGKSGARGGKAPDSPALTEYIHATSSDFDKFLSEIYRKKYNKRHFLVTVEPKEGKDRHPWEQRIYDTDYCFSVNSKKGRSLFLKRNVKYFFTFHNNDESADHEFFFTTDPAGGQRGDQTADKNYEPVEIPGTPRPFSEYKSVSFNVTNQFPKVFYYQDRLHKFLGGLVFVVDDNDDDSASDKKGHDAKKDHRIRREHHHRRHHRDHPTGGHPEKGEKSRSRSRHRSPDRDQKHDHPSNRRAGSPSRSHSLRHDHHRQSRSRSRDRQHDRKDGEHHKHEVKGGRSETPPPPRPVVKERSRSRSRDRDHGKKKSPRR